MKKGKKKLFLMIAVALMISSCSSTKKVVKKREKNVVTAENKIEKTLQKEDKYLVKVDSILANAYKFINVPYKYGGTTKKGMDCSGLVYVAFKSQNYKMPRVTREMAKIGKEVSLDEVKKGDLLFFDTKKTNKKINHVGLVVSKKEEEILFINSTTSKGVIISSLLSAYWKNTFVKAMSVFR
ncbi:C40 family peptidase [Polaribacter sargassicola]|uniref:C40 family peptidase n=1 Tax=Polaribacter sargassicola TaxID=2836891 RepID=UPI001F2AA6C3|nr:C40 family peptidase [Polaribacter sp. DS7-9]MCG1035996.1 DUF1460 domain-containing protein [Polaribacter sp. DS7-9]